MSRLMDQYRFHVFVCTSDSTCRLQGNVDQFVRYWRAEVAKAGLAKDVRINHAGCFSQCGHGPMVVVYPDNVWYHGIQAADLKEIFESHIVGGTPVGRLRYDPGVKGLTRSATLREEAREPVSAGPPPAAGSHSESPPRSWRRIREEIRHSVGAGGSTG